MMWEAIRSNERKSAVLMAVMAFILVAFFGSLGLLIGEGDMPSALVGCVVGAVVWLVLLLVNLSSGESILLQSAGAREVKHSDAPQLYNLVEEMRIAAALPAMPRVYIINSTVPNAFAVGLKPERACVAVTSGLMERLTRDELQGVIAHELGHISNRDTLFMTLAGITMGAIVLASDMLFRVLFWGGGRRRSSGGNNNKGAGAAVIVLIALVLAILSPLIARLLYFACSRQREYLADASAAQFTRYPDALADALQKISGRQNAKTLDANRVVAPMYIINPLAAAGSSSIFGTHPPTAERIKRLRAMRGGFAPVDATPPPGVK